MFILRILRLNPVEQESQESAYRAFAILAGCRIHISMPGNPAGVRILGAICAALSIPACVEMAMVRT